MRPETRRVVLRALGRGWSTYSQTRLRLDLSGIRITENTIRRTLAGLVAEGTVQVQQTKTPAGNRAAAWRRTKEPK